MLYERKIIRLKSLEEIMALYPKIWVHQDKIYEEKNGTLKVILFPDEIALLGKEIEVLIYKEIKSPFKITSIEHPHMCFKEEWIDKIIKEV